MVDPLDIIRAQLGIPPLTSADDYARRLLLVLVATAQPSDHPHPDWDDSIELIGACCYDPTPSTVPGWLAQIAQPVVLVSTSSENQGDSELARVALSAMAEEPVHVVATFPTGLPPEITAPANATVCEFLPSSLARETARRARSPTAEWVSLERLWCAVYRSAWCPVPDGRDQFEVARRVEMKCGTRLLPKDLTAPPARRQGPAGHGDDRRRPPRRHRIRRHRWRSPWCRPERTTAAHLDATQALGCCVNRGWST